MRCGMAQVLPCTEPDSNCTTEGGTGQPGGPLDAEKADMVTGMVQLVAATAGMGRVHHPRGTCGTSGSGMGSQSLSSSRGPRYEGGDDGRGTCADGDVLEHRRSGGAAGADGEAGSARQDGKTEAAPGGQCADADEAAPDAVDFDALERQAAGERFVQVADAGAAAGYGARWRCQGDAAAPVHGKGFRAVAATVSAAATAAQRLARALLRRTAPPAAWVLRVVRSLFSQAADWAPAPLRAVAAIVRTRVQAALHRTHSAAISSDEWWKHDPHRRPTLLMPQGWRRLAADARSRLPSLQEVLLSLSRAVPGFAGVVLLFHRHEALCAAYPPSADLDAAYRTPT